MTNETPTQERAVDRRRRILDAALSVFTRRGYRVANVDEIAEESGTSKGGIYFHFPGKEAIFRALLDLTAKRLIDKIDEAMALKTEPVAKADAALLAVLQTFSEHRSLARLFMIETLGAGVEFHQKMMDLRRDFADIIKTHLDEAVRDRTIQPLDTTVASRAWFGALNEVILHWLMEKEPGRLEDAYQALRPLLMRSVGVSPDRGT